MSGASLFVEEEFVGVLVVMVVVVVIIMVQRIKVL